MFITVCFLIDWQSELLSSDGQINKDVRNTMCGAARKKTPRGYTVKHWQLTLSTFNPWLHESCITSYTSLSPWSIDQAVPEVCGRHPEQSTKDYWNIPGSGFPQRPVAFIYNLEGFRKMSSTHFFLRSPSVQMGPDVNKLTI